MTRTEQKKELMEVLQDAPVKLAERFKRDFERMAFDSDADFNDWIDDVCLAIDHEEDKGKSIKRKALEAWVNDNAYSGGYPFSISGDIRSLPS